MAQLPQIITPNANIKRGSTWSGSFPFHTMDTYIISPISYRGLYEADVDLFPSYGGSGTGGDIMAGDFWLVNSAGTLGGDPANPYDELLALVDTPGQTAANWQIVVATPIDVTTDEWLLTFKGFGGGDVVIALSTANGLLTTGGVDNNLVLYELPFTETEQLTPQNIYGELRNETTHKTYLGIQTAVEDSPNE